MFSYCALLPKAPTRGRPLECIPGNAMPAFIEEEAGKEEVWGRARCAPQPTPSAVSSLSLFHPGSGVPSPPLLSSTVLYLWSLGCCGPPVGLGGVVVAALGHMVTVAGPPSLTVRMPSPRLLHPGRCCAAVVGSSDCVPRLHNSGEMPLHSA